MFCVVVTTWLTWLALLLRGAAGLALAGGKQLILVRHGVSEMNVALDKQPWGSRGFRDPDLRDAPLTAAGRQQAMEKREEVSGFADRLELVVTSPLTRALETTVLAFGHVDAPVVATPLAAERLYLSSDIGLPPGDLGVRFPTVDLSHVRRDDWWYAPDNVQKYREWRPPGEYVCPGEPDDAFKTRMLDLVQWLNDRPEDTIAMVCHWGVIMALCGQDFRNAEIREFTLPAP